MTLHAFDRCWFIENYRIAVEQLYLAMTLIASHALVAATQRKRRPLIVIECGGCPPLLVVAFRTRGFSRFGKLPTVRIFMARFASLRCSLELNLRLTCGNLVASPAGYRAVDTP